MNSLRQSANNHFNQNNDHFCGVFYLKKIMITNYLKKTIVNEEIKQAELVSKSAGSSASIDRFANGKRTLSSTTANRRIVKALNNFPNVRKQKINSLKIYMLALVLSIGFASCQKEQTDLSENDWKWRRL